MSVTESFAVFLLLLCISPFCGGSSGDIPQQELWCVAKNNAEDASLQQALDWACGAGGADCGPIQRGGPCYDADSVLNTASYAFNDYFLKHGMADDSCNFNNNAAVTASNPSHDNCKFPSGMTASKRSYAESTTSSSAGLEPTGSGNLSGCGKVSWKWWFWPLIVISHTLLMVSIFGW